MPAFSSLGLSGALSLTFRGLSIFSRFLLLIVVSKQLDVASLGVFGIMNLSVALIIYALGFDFYVFNTRRIVKATNRTTSSLFISNQLCLHLILYAFFLPFLFLNTWANLIPPIFLGYFMILVFLELFNQEIGRILIAIKKPVTSHFMGFCRNGLWVFVLLVCSYFSLIDFSLEVIFQYWLVFGVFSLVAGIVLLHSNGLIGLHRINTKWLRMGLKSSLIFFMSSLSYKLIEYSDRYFLEYFHSYYEVGVYTFFISICNIIPTLIYTGVISIFLPKLIHFENNNQAELFKQTLRSILISSLILSLGISLFLVIGIDFLIDFTGKVVYREYLNAFYILLIAMNLLSISYTYHYKLYALGRDRHLLISTLIVLVVVLCCNLVLVPEFNVLGAAISLLIGHFCGVFTKYWFSNGVLYSK